jgi:hypothetical protein
MEDTIPTVFCVNPYKVTMDFMYQQRYGFAAPCRLESPAYVSLLGFLGSPGRGHPCRKPRQRQGFPLCRDFAVGTPWLDGLEPTSGATHGPAQRM